MRLAPCTLCRPLCGPARTFHAPSLACPRAGHRIASSHAVPPLRALPSALALPSAQAYVSIACVPDPWTHCLPIRLGSRRSAFLPCKGTRGPLPLASLRYSAATRSFGIAEFLPATRSSLATSFRPPRSGSVRLEGVKTRHISSPPGGRGQGAALLQGCSAPAATWQTKAAPAAPSETSPRMQFNDGIKFIEIAANLTDDMYQGVYYGGKTAHAPDMQAVLARAWDAGIEKMMITAGTLEQSQEALALARTDDRLFCTVGVHPTRCNEFDESGDPEKHLEKLLAIAKEGMADGKVVAIGECGLDYDRLQFCSAEVQKKYFALQFKLAEATGLPMFLHMRAAAADFMEIVKGHYGSFSAGVVHSFTGTSEERDQILADPKLYIGINGCSLKTAENLEAVKGIPPERMMLETDCPYCDIRSTHAGASFIKSKWPAKKKEAYDPSSMVKGRNEPCQIRQVLEVVCGVKGEKDPHAFAQKVYDATEAIFFKKD